MTFETMDWNAEANRIAAAFKAEALRLWLGTPSKAIIGADLNWEYAVLLEVHYRSDEYLFVLHSKSGDLMRFVIYDDGRYGFNSFYSGLDTLPFLCALFVLNLLPARFEENSRNNMSAHQKIEWTIEYEDRLKSYDTNPVELIRIF